MRSLKGAAPVPVASVDRPAAHHIVTVGLGVVREIQGCKSKSKDSSERYVWSLYVGASSYQSVVDFLN